MTVLGEPFCPVTVRVYCLHFLFRLQAEQQTEPDSGGSLRRERHDRL